MLNASCLVVDPRLNKEQHNYGVHARAYERQNKPIFMTAEGSFQSRKNAFISYLSFTGHDAVFRTGLFIYFRDFLTQEQMGCFTASQLELLKNISSADT